MKPQSRPAIVFWMVCSMLYLCTDETKRLDRLEASTSTGLVKGFEFTTRSGRSAIGFTRIPYAEPPVGDLRFAEAKSPDPWKGILEATKESPVCMQFNVIVPGLNETVGQEDCLYLNVYTPVVKDSSLPVIVYFHGGAWYFGGTQGHGPEYILDENVVLVTANFRLGPFGFLSMEDNILPGNLGLKDQNMVLRWVKDNIKSFKGDPNQVMLLGESAGGASCHLHMYSPLSKGLIHKVMSMSGVANAEWSFFRPGIVRNRTRRLAESLNCGLPKTKEIIECLRKLPARNIEDAMRQFFVWDMDPISVIGPVLEKNSPKSFLPVNPRKEKSPSIPWITGISSGEGLVRTTRFHLNGEKDFIRLNTQFEKWIPISLLYNNLPGNTKELNDKIRAFYFGHEPITERTLSNLTKMYTDMVFLYPMREAILRHSGPVYVYYYDYQGRASFFDLLTKSRFSNQPVHTDETLYIFNFTSIFPPLQGEDENISKTLVKLITNFARFDQPTLATDFISWEPWDKKRLYLSITKEGVSMKENLFDTSYEFVKSLKLYE